MVVVLVVVFCLHRSDAGAVSSVLLLLCSRVLPFSVVARFLRVGVYLYVGRGTINGKAGRKSFSCLCFSFALHLGLRYLSGQAHVINGGGGGDFGGGDGNEDREL